MVSVVYKSDADTRLDSGVAELLKVQVRGEVILPDDSRYDAARAIWNGMIDKRPSAIVVAADEADVQTVVRFAAQQGLTLSVKGGGHNVAGHAVSEGGITIDLSSLRDVQVDPERRTARVQGGALWADVDEATATHGLATTGGVISSTGVGGLTLGGGIGWLMGRHGMSIDNLLSARVVTADGAVVTASETSHPDLFWAIRGGGGNFGIVTEFEFTLHPVGEVLAGFFAYPVSEAREVFEYYRQFTEDAPEELGCYARISTDPESGMRVVAVAVFWPGDIDEGQRVIQPLRDFKTPLVEMVGPMPYGEWQKAFDAEFPHGRRYYWKSTMVKRLSGNLLDAIVRNAADVELPLTIAVIEWYRGPMNLVPNEATAFASREAEYQIVGIGAWDEPSDDEAGIAWTRKLHRDMQPYSLNRAFLNFDSSDTTDRSATIAAAYGQNWSRLVEIKNRYDPENLFSENNNISPSGA